MSRLTSSLAALDAARPAYEEAYDFYEGNANETFMNPVLQQKLGSESAAFSFNYARLVITSRLSRMEVSSISSQDGSADDILAALWSENALDQELQDAFEASLVYGDAYLIGEADENSFNIFYNSPLDTRVFYSAENPRLKSHAVKRWLTEEGKLRVNIYTSDAIEKYITKGKPTSQMQDADFEQFVEDDSVWPLPNETGAIPVFHLRTGRMYGTPEHAQAFGPQRAITKLLSSQLESIDYQTGPQRYMIQDAKANSAIDPAQDFGELDADDEDPASGLRSGPNGIWNLKGVSSVGQFDPVSPDVFVTPFKTFIEAIGTVTSTPVHAFNVGALPSGESLRAAEAPLNKRVESLELLFGATLRELHEYALDVLGLTGTKVMVGWAPVATYDDADMWSTVKAKTDAGVPLRSALMEAGYTAEQVDEWYPENTQAWTTGQLDALGTAIQKIASGITLGLITAEEGRAMLPQGLTFEQPVANPATVLDSIEG